MTNVPPFPGSVSAVGERFPAATLSAGLDEAERRGIARTRSAAVLGHDRPIATYMLCLLGSADGQDRRCGEVGLLRLLEGMETTA